MISDEFCKQQLSRLSQKRNRPQTPEAVRELIRALQETCTSELDCHEVISEALDYEFHPEPMELRRLAWQLKQPAWAPAASECQCHGVGFVTVRRSGYDYARPCVCRSRKEAS